MAKVCTRYEVEIYGAALFRAIKDKTSKLMILLILLALLFIGYVLILYRRRDEEQEALSEQEAVRCERKLEDYEDRRGIVGEAEKEALPESRPAEKTEAIWVASKPERDDFGALGSLATRGLSGAIDLQEGVDIGRKSAAFLRQRRVESEGANAAPMTAEPSRSSLTKDVVDMWDRPLKSANEIPSTTEGVEMRDRLPNAANVVSSPRDIEMLELFPKPAGGVRPERDVKHVEERSIQPAAEILAAKEDAQVLERPSKSIDEGPVTDDVKVWERPVKHAQEVSYRDSLSDKSDTTIRRKSSRWDSDEPEQAEEKIQEATLVCSEAAAQKELPLYRSSVDGGRRELHHNYSTEEIKSARKTWSDTDRASRAASVDDDWLERERYFETLHSARSSISASSLSLLVGSTSQERLSEHSLQSLTEVEPIREGSVPLSETSRLQRTVQQLYSGRIEDRFDSLEEVSRAIEEAGLVHSRIIIGIDYTTSNMETGRKTFGGKCLHTIKYGEPNPYQEVIRILCKTLNQFDEDNMICAYGFGDSRTNDQHVFKLNPASLYCHGFEGVLDAYNLITPIIKLGGPTTFAPIIDESVKIVQSSRMYTILIIIADGQLVDESDTARALVEASNYPLSIILVGVGDGPWDKMREFDDALPQRKFDNFQFVNYHQVLKLSSMLPGQSPDSLFALMALMEIPDQYLQIKQLGYLDETTGRFRRNDR